MSSRKRTKRRNSDEDFDVDEEDDGPDNDDTNKWACHSCTFMNRAAAYRCFVCGTRKGTSTRRSRVNDNVVEMQKTITTLVQKQVEKEKSMKRRERSLLKSVPREASGGPETSKEIKQEVLNISESDDGQKSSTSSTPAPVLQKVSTPEVVKTPTKVLKTEAAPEKIDSPVANTKISSPKKEKQVSTTQIEIGTNNKSPEKNDTSKSIKKEPEDKKVAEIREATPAGNKPEITAPKPEITPPSIDNISQKPPELSSESPSSTGTTALPTLPVAVPPTGTPNTLLNFNGIVDSFLLQHLPERVVKKIHQPIRTDYQLLVAHKRLTGIDPIVAEGEAVLLPQDWNRHKVIKTPAHAGTSNHCISPTTSRQSSETDSSSSDANKSLDAPLNDLSTRPSKSCQIPDYMIHRESSQKIFIVANGFPAYFEEFPRRIPQPHP